MLLQSETGAEISCWTIKSPPKNVTKDISSCSSAAMIHTWIKSCSAWTEP